MSQRKVGTKALGERSIAAYCASYRSTTGFLIFYLIFLSLFCVSTVAAAPLTQEEQVSISIYKQASPAVVNITTTTMVRDFFSIYPQQGAGSGAIIGPNGYLLTNNHVVEGASDITVTLTDGRKFKARLVGADPANDIAVLKIDGEGTATFPALDLGDSDTLQVGQKVFAIGNPFGLNSTLTAGIISALGRPLAVGNGMVIENVIQTDASINPGNSGGPLLDTSGKLIGITTAIFTPSGGNIGIGFAIPANTAGSLIPDLLKFGKIRRPWLGIVGVPLWRKLAHALDLPVDEGIMVSAVIEGSPAHKAGLRGGVRPVSISGTTVYLGGDVLLEIDGKKVSSMSDISKALRSKKDEDAVDIKILRGKGVSHIKMPVELER